MRKFMILVFLCLLAVYPAISSSSAQELKKEQWQFFKAPPQSKPSQALTGTYRCDSIQVEGKKQRCTSPPLVLNSDGSYQIWNEQGTFKMLELENKYVVLSESRKRGPGLLKKNGREIVFEYDHGSRKVTVTFKRVDTPPPGSAFV